MGNVNQLGPSIDPNQIYQNDLNIDNDLQTTKATVSNNSAAISAQQAQLDTTQATANSASTAITTHIAQTTGAHAASAISETRLGDAQTALNDVNTRVTNIVGQTGSSNTEIVDARQSTPENNTFTVLKDRLDTSDNIQAIIDQARADITREAINSGVYRFSTVTAGNTATPNTFAIAQEEANANGQRLNLGTPTIQLNAPPSANVTPALPGSARDDLIFLEMWKQWVAPGGTLYTNGNVNGTTTVATYGQYQWQWREREVDGVDFATYPEGLSATNVYAQGARGTVGTVVFTKSATDSGLYTASDATGGPIDGLVYVVPLFRVRRRNTTAYNVDTNPLGGQPYGAYTDTSAPLARNPGQSSNLIFNVASVTWLVGDYIYVTNNGGMIAQVTAISSAAGTTTVTVTAITTFGSAGQWANYSDRPDGLYSNIIDATDIVDLRHQVSLTGFNNQALLEKNLDLLLRGKLNTVDTPRYTNDNIGLNLSGYTDDANTLLFLNFDGTINGTANGVAVAATGGLGNYVNGVQGTALSCTSLANYPVVVSGTQGEIEFFVKFSSFTAGSIDMFDVLDASSNKVLRIIQGVSTFQMIFSNGTTQLINVSTTLPSSKYNPSYFGNWHYAKVNWNGTAVSAQVDDVVFTGTLPQAWNGGTSFVMSPFSSYGAFDLLRISNIVRTGTPLPTGFSYTEGDRILDGAMADFNTWSDDVGGITGVNGRTNPYGLTHVPNQMHTKVNYNGAEVREYYGTGVTPGWSAATSPSSGELGNSQNPAGAFDFHFETLATVKPNETVDGTRTTFTFSRPSNASGLTLFRLFSYNLNVSGGTVSSASVDASGTITVVLTTAPIVGTNLYMNISTGARHAHLIPSTKGFVLHDWTDDTYSSVNGTQTAFQTTKYNVTSLNHVRVTPSASTVATIQNGGYTATGLNARTTTTAGSAVSAVTLTVASTANFVTGQNIRAQKGDGTWLTTTCTVTNSTTLTVPALASAIAQNAIVEGAAVVTFTTAPAAVSNVDLVYESVITPSEGDYLRVAYQHTPYQGIADTIVPTVSSIYLPKELYITSIGTGTNVGATANGSLSKGYGAISTNLPAHDSSYDYGLKQDAVNATAGDAYASTTPSWGQPEKDFRYDSIQSPMNISASESLIETAPRATTSFSSAPGVVPVLRGIAFDVGYMDNNIGFFGRQLATTVPHLTIYASLVIDTTKKEVYLAITCVYSNSNQAVIGNGAPTDVYHTQGRPLIKGYGGVTN